MFKNSNYYNLDLIWRLLEKVIWQLNKLIEKY